MLEREREEKWRKVEVEALRNERGGPGQITVTSPMKSISGQDEAEDITPTNSEKVSDEVSALELAEEVNKEAVTETKPTNSITESDTMS